MSNGSREPESPKDVQCKHCGKYFRNDGVHGHEPNCPLKEVDATVVPLRGAHGEGDATPRPGVETPTEPTDSEDLGGHPTPGADVETASVEEPGISTETADPETSEVGADPRARTDGGPRTPPEPDVTIDEDEDDDEHMVPVDEFLTDVESQLPGELVASDRWQEFRDELEGDELVDLEESDLASGEVTTVDV